MLAAIQPVGLTSTLQLLCPLKTDSAIFTHQNTNGICFHLPLEQIMEKGKASHMSLEGRAKDNGKFSQLPSCICPLWH